MLHILRTKKYDVVNGPGVRCSIWLSGCNNHCPECWASDTWNPLTGEPYSLIKDKIEEMVANPLNEGVSILGGDPLYHIFNNGDGADEVIDLLKLCKKYDKKVWMWTGYSYERIFEECAEILDYVDVLIDGKFVNELKDLKLFYRGSSNQRVIDVKESLKAGQIIGFERDF